MEKIDKTRIKLQEKMHENEMMEREYIKAFNIFKWLIVLFHLFFFSLAVYHKLMLTLCYRVCSSTWHINYSSRSFIFPRKKIISSKK